MEGVRLDEEPVLVMEGVWMDEERGLNPRVRKHQAFESPSLLRYQFDINISQVDRWRAARIWQGVRLEPGSRRQVPAWEFESPALLFVLNV